MTRSFRRLGGASFSLIFFVTSLLIPGFCPSAEAAPKGKDKVPVRAIISYQKIKGGTVFYGDMLEGLDYSKSPAPFTDKKAASLRVGTFASKDPDGTTQSLRYENKVLYPDQSYLRGSVKMVRKNAWLEDLMNIYQRKLKACKNESDKKFKARMMSRLYNWCNSNFLFKYADKLEKELERLEKIARGEIEEEEESEESEDDGFDPAARDAEIEQACKDLPSMGKVIVRSSEHIVLVTDMLPEKTLKDMLKLGERVIKDFSEFMYEDEDIPGIREIPDEEIVRMIMVERIETFEAALKNASSIAPTNGVIRDKVSLERSLSMGGQNFTSKVGRKVVQTNISSGEKGNPEDTKSIQETTKDYQDCLVHQVGHALIHNHLRSNTAASSGRRVMPWLSEGMAIYLSIKHLGSKNTACVDFSKKKMIYAEQKKKEKKDEEAFFGDIEAMVNKVALDDSANTFCEMIRVPEMNRMKPETMAKGFSMIDFLIETDRVGFVTFINKIQKHYKVLYREKDLSKFVREMDDIVKESFAGASVKKGRKVIHLDSVETMEEAWRDWAKGFVIRKK